MSEPKTQIFEHGGQKIPYRVIFDRHKTVRLRLDNASCAVVKMPFSLSKDYAQKMLLKHFQWIVQKQEEQKNISAKPETEEIFIFGRAFSVAASPSPRNFWEKLRFAAQNTYFNQEQIFLAALPAVQTAHPNICLTANTLHVQCRNSEDCLKKLAAWRKKSAQAFLPAYYERLWQVFREQSSRFLLQHRVHTAYHTCLPPLTIRSCRRTYGSCRISPKRQETGITLSAHLMGLPLEYIEFVILHEFCHLIFPDHSPRFYALFDCVLPRHKSLKAAANAWSKTHNPF